MSTPYMDVFRGFALRTKQFVGGATAAREAAFTNANPTTQTDGVDLPPSAIKQDVLIVERELVQAIGMSDNKLLRAGLAQSSDNILSGASIPTVDASNAPFFGKLDGIFDQTDDRSLTEATKEEIDYYLDNPGTFFKIRPYHFCEIGDVVFHTRTGAYYRGVSWDYDVQSTAYDAQGASPLHTSLLGLWIDLACANCAQEDWFLQEAGVYAAAARQKWQLFFPGVPMPDTRARMYPAKD